MPINVKELFYKIVNGDSASYREFIQKRNNHSISCDYKDFFDFLLAQPDLKKCSYYALYDACQYIIESFQSNKDELIAKLYPQIINAAINGNLAARCMSIILQTKFQFVEVKKDFFKELKTKTLAAITKLGKNDQNERMQWLKLFMAIYGHRIEKLPNENKQDTEKFNNYFNLYKINAATCHYYIYYLNDKANQPETSHAIKDLINVYKNKRDMMVCLDVIIQRMNLNLMPIITNVHDQVSSNSIIQALQSIKDYNPPKINYLIGKYYVKCNNYGHPNSENNLRVLEFLETAKENGYKEADLEAYIEKAKVLKNQLIQKPRNTLTEQSKSNPVPLEALTFPDNKTIVIGDKIFLKDKHSEILFEEILLKIECDSEIATLIFYGVQLDFDIARLISSLEKNKNIDNISVKACEFSPHIWLRIINFLTKRKSLKTLCLENLKLMTAPAVDKTKMLYDLFENSVVKLLESLSGLDELKLDFRDYIHSPAIFLSSLSKNMTLKDTRLKLFLEPDSEQLNLLGNLSHFSNLELIFDDIEFDASAIQSFSEKLKKNTTLKHLALRNFVQDTTDKKLSDAFFRLVKTLLQDLKLESLDLSYAFPGEEICKNTENLFLNNIEAYLKSNTSLKKINLSENLLDDNYLTKIANGLRLNTKIEALNLSNNPFTTKGAINILRAFSNFKNNLKSLDLLSSSADKFEFNDFYQALYNFIVSGNCVLEDISLNISTQTLEKQTWFANFLSILTTNKTIQKIYLEGSMTIEIMTKLIEVVTANKNIVRLICPVEGIDDSFKEQLKNQLAINRSLALSKPVVETIEKDIVTPVKVTQRKASFDTFGKLLEDAELKNAPLTIEGETIIINFESPLLAQSAVNTLNDQKVISKVEGTKVVIENYQELNEIDILSKSILLKHNLQNSLSENQKNNSIVKQSLLIFNYFSNISHIFVQQYETNLIIKLGSNLKVTPEFSEMMLLKIVDVLKDNKINCTFINGQVHIPNFNAIELSSLEGIQGKIKKLLKADYTAFKKGNKSSQVGIPKQVSKREALVQEVPHKLKQITIKEEVKEINPSLELAEEVLDQPVMGSFEFIVNNALAELPTEIKFKELAGRILKSDASISMQSNLDKTKLLIFRHHHILFAIHSLTNNEDLNAYATLYHAIRIAELSYNYMKGDDPSLLKKTTYGMRSILADQTQTYLPGSAKNALELLQRHPQSFLMVSRRILLELFNNCNDLTTQVHQGYAQVYYYKKFYKNHWDTSEKLPTPKHLTESPLNVLQEMLAVAQFIRVHLSNVDLKSFDNAACNVAFYAFKGALFLLGHFARILRDHHYKFNIRELLNAITVNNFSQKLNGILIDNFRQEVLLTDFNLIDHMSTLNEETLNVMLNQYSFADACLLFITARNNMAHSREEDNERLVADCLFDEISPQALNFFNKLVNGENFISKLKNLMERAEKYQDSPEDDQASSQTHLSFFAKNQEVQIPTHGKEEIPDFDELKIK